MNLFRVTLTAGVWATALEQTAIRFETIDCGKLIGERNVQRLAVADLDHDGRCDLILERERVYLNRTDGPSAGQAKSPEVRFASVASGLRSPGADGVSIYVDLDGDQIPDAFTVRSVDLKRAESEAAANAAAVPEQSAPAAPPLPAAWWQRGRGDGTFDAPISIPALRPASACAIAAGDVDRDGRTDLFIGNWYTRYGESVEAFTSVLLLNRRGDDGMPRFEQDSLPESAESFDEERDAAGRPMYGALIADLCPQANGRPQLLALAYGRRWNRLYAWSKDATTAEPIARWTDVAPAIGLDGDADRSGVYPPWAGRGDEKPFRANGNTFDGAVGDIDGDGDMDCLLVEITHAWAGSSSDRSRVLLAEPTVTWPGVRFVPSPAWSLDRAPKASESSTKQSWNQGDLFGEFADLDNDGKLDVILASGDYPDPPPNDQRLRIFQQLPGDPNDPSAPRLADVTLSADLRHRGSAQFAVCDVDGDGRRDIIAGQSFHRFTKEMIDEEGGTPSLRLFRNITGNLDGSGTSNAITLRLEGDPSKGIATEAFGAHIRSSFGGTLTARVDQLIGPGGHAGQECESTVHIGLGTAREAESIEIRWPNAWATVTRLAHVAAGRYVVRPDGTIRPDAGQGAPVPVPTTGP